MIIIIIVFVRIHNASSSDTVMVPTRPTIQISICERDSKIYFSHVDALNNRQRRQELSE